MGHNALETRVLEGGLWAHVPQSIQDFDVQMRESIITWVDRTQSPWTEIAWLTQSNVGIKLGFSFLVILVALYLRGRISILLLLRHLSMLTLSLGISDLVSSLIKKLFGRLKPHVGFIDPGFSVALSFPSNHSFNTSFLFFLIYGIMSPTDRIQNRLFILSVGIPIVLFVGLSRILLNQHYPLDVLGGWLLGGSLGFGFSYLYHFAFRFIFENRTKPR
jgi:membrane-associated phospholipid phosphatase